MVPRKANRRVNRKPYDEVGNIISYEQGELSNEGIVYLFQHLVDNGHAWSLQGSYGRMAANLIEAGLVRGRGGCAS
jgi:hypothetical protein